MLVIPDRWIVEISTLSENDSPDMKMTSLKMAVLTIYSCIERAATPEFSVQCYIDVAQFTRRDSRTSASCVYGFFSLHI
jgi:hypothetical protein